MEEKNQRNHGNTFDLYEKIDVSHEDDLYFLRKYALYSKETTNAYSLFYDNKDSSLAAAVRKRYGLETIFSMQGRGIKEVAAIKQIAVDLMEFKGKELGEKRYDNCGVTSIIDLAKAEGFSLNCRYKTYIFTAMLLAVGFKARMVKCLSMDLRYRDCHWVTEVFIEDEEKWIVADAAFDLFYFDKCGNLLNLYEMREKTINGNAFRFVLKNKENLLYVEQYWVKSLFRFQFLLNNRIESFALSKVDVVGLNPKGFVMQNKVVGKFNYIYTESQRNFWGETLC